MANNLFDGREEVLIPMNHITNHDIFVKYELINILSNSRMFDYYQSDEERKYSIDEMYYDLGLKLFETMKDNEITISKKESLKNCKNEMNTYKKYIIEIEIFIYKRIGNISA